MRLQGQGGYAMAVLLVGMSVMAIMMTVAMPVWKQTTQREKEAELVFRGEQYARAIGLFQRKNGPGVLPPSIDVLVDQRFLRRKYKDPITGEDFLPLMASLGAPRPGQSTGRGGNAVTPGTSTVPASSGQAPVSAGQTASPGQAPGSGATGGLIGVQSKSKAPSIRIYNGRTHYNEWVFVFQQQTQAPGVGAPGQPGRPGQPGQPGQPQVPIGPGGQRGTPRGGFNPFPETPQPRRPGR